MKRFLLTIHGHSLIAKNIFAKSWFFSRLVNMTNLTAKMSPFISYDGVIRVKTCKVSPLRNAVELPQGAF